MTLSGLYSKEETKKHGLIKFMCFIMCTRMGNKSEVEFDAGKGIGIFDCVDWTNGLVYEPIASKSKKIRQKKIDKYLRYAGIKDVIFIDVNQFDEDEPISVWWKRLESLMV